MDLCGNEPEVVRQHLRIDPSNLDESSDLDLFRGAWEDAAAVLVIEEGHREAFSRFASLPVPLPPQLLDELDALAPDEKRTFVRGLLDLSISPLGAVHLVRALSWLGRTERKYVRLATRLIRKWADPWLSRGREGVSTGS